MMMDNTTASYLLALNKSSPLTAPGAPPPATQAEAEAEAAAAAAAAGQAAASLCNPRISNALMELKAAEAMLAASKSSTTTPGRSIHPNNNVFSMMQPSPWLLQSLLSTMGPAPSITAAVAAGATGNSSALHNRLQISQVLQLAHDMPPLTPLGMDDASSSTSYSAVREALQTKNLKSKNKKTEKKNQQQQPQRATTPADETSATTTNACDGTVMLLDMDVLCGRGGKSNHHPGNKRYRQVICQMKAGYRQIGSKTQKTSLSHAIVGHVYLYGGRFLKYEKADDKFVILSPSEARKKTSQALREAKQVKWV
jgi:hypothetical protein